MTEATHELLSRSLRGHVDQRATATGITPLRLPRSAEIAFDSPFIAIASSQASGVRLEFTTAATWIELAVDTTGIIRAWDPTPDPAIFSVTVDGRRVADVAAPRGSSIFFAPPAEPTLTAGEPFTLRFDLGGDGTTERPVAIWLPQTASVELRHVSSDRPLAPAAPAVVRSWWHHGSSISHCVEADSPLAVWPVAASRQLGLAITNLGFGANAHLDQFTARAIRDSGADLISIKIGINIVGGDTMKRRTFLPAIHGFLDTIRDGAPNTPILVISPIICPIHEDAPGRTLYDRETGEQHGNPNPPPSWSGSPLTLRSIREILAEVVAVRSRDDAALFYLDGLELFGEADLHNLPDGLHPNTAGYLDMADRFAHSPIVRAWMESAR